MLVYKIVRPIATFIVGLWFRVNRIDTYNIPQTDGAILAGNHKNAIDPVLACSCTKRIVRNIGKKSLSNGVFGFFFRSMGMIPVDRDTKNPKAISTSLDVLHHNGLIGIYPEGKRNKTNNLLLPFKFGAVSMAQKTGKPIIPYAIVGNYKFRNTIKIKFGNPMWVSETSDLSEANEQLFDTIKNLILELQ